MILNNSTVEVKRTFHASAEKLFNAIGEGILFRTCGAIPASIKSDFREGGDWSVSFGDFGPVAGKFLSLVKNRKIVFTWGENGTVTVTLSENKGATEMHLLHEGIKENVSDFDHGWRDGVNDFTPLMTRMLKIVRELPTTPAKAFALFSRPDFFHRCKADPATEKFDFRVEGKYSHNKTADCDAKFLSGEFTDIQQDKRIAFTWNTDDLRTLVLIDFKASTTGTTVTLTHAGFPDEASEAGHNKGWTQVLDGIVRDAV